MIEQLFEVAAEFQFNIGEALLNTKTLQGAVDDLSKSTDSALHSLGYLTNGLVAHLGLGSGGLLSIMMKAVKVSEAFDNTALNLAGTINLATNGVGSFNEHLQQSETILGNIVDTANQFGLPAGALSAITQNLALPLGKNAGPNFKNATELGKNVMMSSEMLGMNPEMISHSLIGALQQRQAIPRQVFQRLALTNTFRQGGIVQQSQFMNIGNVDKKFKLINDAFKELANSGEPLEHRLNSLSKQMTILKNYVVDVGSFLKPIGDALKQPLIIILKGVNDYLRKYGKDMAGNIAMIFKDLLKDPQAFLVNLMQVKRLGNDLKKAWKFTEYIAGFRFLTYILGQFGIVLNGGLLRKGLAVLWDGIVALYRVIPFAVIIKNVFSLLSRAITTVLSDFIPLLFFFQIISRSIAKARLDDAKSYAEMLPDVTKQLLRTKVAFQNILFPVTMAIDFISDFTKYIFTTSLWLRIVLPLWSKMNDVLDAVGFSIVATISLLSALFSAFLQFADNIIHLRNPMENVIGMFDYKFKDSMDKYLAKAEDPTKAAANTVNNNNITLNVDMREQMEPDRIAFSLVQHLKKVTMNSPQGRGQTYGKIISGSVPQGN